MRTTVNIREDVLKDLLRYSKGKTRTAAVNHALEDWVRLRKIQELRALRGRLDIATDLKAFRVLDAKGT